MADDPQLWHVAAEEESMLTRAATSSRPQRSQKLSVAATGVPHFGHVPGNASSVTSVSEV
jgi:hypothetical protein